MPSPTGNALEFLRLNATEDGVEWAAGSGGYTDEEAQDAIVAMLAATNTIGFTYTDLTPELTFDVLYQDSLTINLSDDASGLKADLIIGATDNTETNIMMWDGDSIELRTVASLNIPTVTPAALTKSDDTNVTLTLGGTPATALLQATSLTLGWSGQLSLARGGTGANLADPGADRILFWDDSAGAVTWLTLGTNLTITDTTLDASGSGASEPDTQVVWGTGSGIDSNANFTFDDATNLLTLTGKQLIVGGSADWTVAMPGTTTGSLHIAPASTDHFGGAITFGASDSGSGLTAQAGIYTRTDGAYGTRMYFATTNNYTNGSQTGFMLSESGKIAGGESTTSTLTLVPTIGNAASGAKIMLNAGNNGGTTGLTVFDNGHVSAGYGTAPTNFSTLSFSVNTSMAIVSNAAGNTPSLSIDYDRTALGGSEERVTWGIRIDTDGKLAWNQARSGLGSNIDRFWITEDGVFTLGGNGTYGFGGFEATGPNQYITIGGAAWFNSGNQQNDFRVDGTSDYLIYGYAFANSVGIGTNNPQAKLDVRGSLLVNEDGNDVDVRFESDTHTDAFFLDGTDGAISFGAYGGGSITGTATYALAVDTNGKVIEVALGGGSYTDENAQDAIFTSALVLTNGLTGAYDDGTNTYTAKLGGTLVDATTNIDLDGNIFTIKDGSEVLFALEPGASILGSGSTGQYTFISVIQASQLIRITADDNVSPTTITVDGANGKIFLQEGSLSAASNGYVWTLVDDATGEGEWAPQTGGSGISRSVVLSSGNATMGSSANVDYVYFVTGAHTLSLPAASGNTNRYTVRNNHSADITVDTAGAETIDGAASITITPEDSVDLMSDGTNWFVV